MECLNKIELSGVVGIVKRNVVDDSRVVRFSVEVRGVWFTCTAWVDDAPDAWGIEEGDWVRLVGRVRLIQYTTTDGVSKQTVDVFVNRLKHEKAD